MVVLDQDPRKQLEDDEIRPLLVRCMELTGNTQAAGLRYGDGNYAPEVAKLMGEITEINTMRAFALLSPSLQQAWSALTDEYEARKTEGGREGLRPKIGSVVRITGLTSQMGKEHLNGREACVSGWDEALGRAEVDLMLHDNHHPEVKDRTAAMERAMPPLPDELLHCGIKPSNLQCVRTCGGIFRTNAYGFEGGEEADGGAMEGGYHAALYSVCCRMNHSCNPNVVKRFARDGTVRLYANTDVAEGKELFNSYVWTGHPRKTRHDLLLSKYKFECACERCAHEAKREQA